MRLIRIDIAEQRLTLLENEQEMGRFACSTSVKGVGEMKGSEQTPRGWHRVRARIGEGMPLCSVFVGRRPTGEIWTPELAARHEGRDWILTRILWLCGNEPGRNRRGDCDTMQRYIYIHGTPPTEPMGVPRSHGCIRLHDPALLKVFAFADVGCLVHICA